MQRKAEELDRTCMYESSSWICGIQFPDAADLLAQKSASQGVRTQANAGDLAHF